MLWAFEVALLVNLIILVSVIMIRFSRKSMISVIFDSIDPSQHDFLENNKFECYQPSFSFPTHSWKYSSRDWISGSLCVARNKTRGLTITRPEVDQPGFGTSPWRDRGRPGHHQGNGRHADIEVQILPGVHGHNSVYFRPVKHKLKM